MSTACRSRRPVVRPRPSADPDARGSSSGGAASTDALGAGGCRRCDGARSRGARCFGARCRSPISWRTVSWRPVSRGSRQAAGRSCSMSEADREHVLARGVGITNVVSRATARADELSVDELRAGGSDLERRVTELGPDVVAFAGITAYRTAFDDRGAKAGRQERTLGGAALWMWPTPAGSTRTRRSTRWLRPMPSRRARPASSGEPVGLQNGAVTKRCRSWALTGYRPTAGTFGPQREPPATQDARWASSAPSKPATKRSTAASSPSMVMLTSLRAAPS